MSVRIKGRFAPTGVKIGNDVVVVFVPPVEPDKPEWVTQSGYLGSFNEGDDIIIDLIAEDPDDDIVGYAITGGELPNGLSLNPFSGQLLGNVQQIPETTTFYFEVTVRDSLNQSNARNFEIQILNVASQVQWITPEGNVGDSPVGGSVYNRIEAISE